MTTNYSIELQPVTVPGQNGGGGMTSFTVNADSGTPQSVTNATTVTFIGGTGIDTAVSATRNVTISVNGDVVLVGDVPSLSIATTQLTGTLQAAQFPALTGDITTVAGALATTLATVNANVGSFALATVTVNAKGLVTAASAASTTGTGAVVLASSPTIVTPTIASFANATHTHLNAAGGGTLDAAAIATGTFSNALINWASPGTLGSSTPNTVAGTTATFSGNLTLSGAPGRIKPAVDSTASIVIANAASTTIASWDTTNARLRIGDASAPLGTLDVAGALIVGSTGNITRFGNDGNVTLIPSRLTLNSPTMVISNNSNGNMQFLQPTATTNAVVSTHLYRVNSSGTPAQGFGMALLHQLESSTTNDQDAARRHVLWLTATHASRESRILDTVYTVATETGVMGQTIDGTDIDAAQAHHFGRPDASGDWADGTWRIIRSINDLLIQRRESSAWVTKSTIAA